MKEFWNERYEKKEFIYGEKPNAFFKSELSKLKSKGKALFSLEGEGRNACYAAKLGWKVDAFDYAKAGKLKAEKLCSDHNSTINYSIAKAEDFNFKTEEYDLVVLIYSHLPSNIRRDFHQKAVDTLKPKGKIILEAFHPRQLSENYPSGGPKNADLLYSLSELKKDFQDLSKVEGKELEIQLDEGAYHQGMGFITRLTGVK